MAKYFLPWHRWMLFQYENLIRQVNCKVTVTYLDWSLISAEPFNNEFWKDTLYSFGGNGIGDPPCVNTGQLVAVSLLDFRTTNDFDNMHVSSELLKRRNGIFNIY